MRLLSDEPCGLRQAAAPQGRIGSGSSFQSILDEWCRAVDNEFSRLAEEDMAFGNSNIASLEERSDACFEGAWA